jgi:hypothetical protein
MKKLTKTFVPSAGPGHSAYVGKKLVKKPGSTRFGSILAILIGTSMAAGKVTTGGEPTLGQFPLCEASAALIIACPNGKGDCLLVGDNEQRNDLFVFNIQDGVIDPRSQKMLSMALSKDNELSDIEALAALSSDTVLVVGSHSRNTKCEANKKRRRFMEVKLSGNRAEVLQSVQTRKIQCDRIFGKIPPGDALMRAACETIDQAERMAEKVEEALARHQISEEQAKDQCNEITPFSAEGVVSVPAEDGVKIWIGLRAPLVSVHPRHPELKNLALLLRLKDPTDYAFDRVALLDLGGRGIRDLATTKGMVLLIAGPPGDRDEPFDLRRFPIEALQGTDVIKPEFVQALPASSEGLAIKGDRA